MNDAHRAPLRWIPSFPKLVISLILFGELVHRSIGLVLHPDVFHAWGILAWIGAMVLIADIFRQFHLTKMRVISDTMRTRLERMAPHDRLVAISRLSIPDLVSLRLASDEELEILSGGFHAGMRRRFPE